VSKETKRFLALFCVALSAPFLIESFKLIEDARRFLQDLDKATVQLTATEAGLAADSKAIREHVDRVLIAVGATAVTVEKSSRAQQKYWEGYGEQVSTDLAQLGQLMKDTDEKLNRGVLPAAEASLKQSVESQKALVASFGDIEEKLSPVVLRLGDVAGHADEIVAASAPYLKEATDNLAIASKAAAGTMQHSEQAMLHVENSTAYAEAYVKKLTSPASTAKTIVLGIGHFVSAFGPALGRIF